ncbi:hypothetical protein HHK36_013359 [Tetracentron sinense]|uniref:Uncharacterized protein n=1 Tax=Tetracentron sinense TaxID=13715 RepID=A0A834Z7I9_TETSI|nr:hypothetical protein HHK36_013359 [Tetracentron sinense]
MSGRGSVGGGAAKTCESTFSSSYKEAPRWLVLVLVHQQKLISRRWRVSGDWAGIIGLQAIREGGNLQALAEYDASPGLTPHYVSVTSRGSWDASPLPAIEFESREEYLDQEDLDPMWEKCTSEEVPEMGNNDDVESVSYPEVDQCWSGRHIESVWDPGDVNTPVKESAVGGDILQSGKGSNYAPRSPMPYCSVEAASEDCTLIAFPSKLLMEDEVKKGELEADKDKMMREYRAQLDAERASKLALGRNHSSSKSNHKRDRKEKDKDFKKRSSKKRKHSRRRSSESTSSSSSRNLQEDEVKKGELEADKDKMMREYRAQLDAERASKLALGRNHSSSKSNHKRDRKEKDKDFKKRSSKKRKHSRRRSSESTSSSSSSESSSSDDEERKIRRSKSKLKRKKKERKHRSRTKHSSSDSEEGDGPLPLSRFFGSVKS